VSENPIVPVNALLDVLCAAHLTNYVKTGIEDRGGIMLVGPPGTFKSTLLGVVGRQYYDSLQLSDVNVQTLSNFRSQIAGGNIKTLVLPEMYKLYERHSSTASNLEGTLRALVAEGFYGAGFQDQRINRLTARCVVLGAMTDAFIEARFKVWEETGFNRRFLWPLFRLEDPDALERAIVQGRLIDLGFRAPPLPNPPQIPDETTESERAALRPFLKHQPGGSPHALQLSLLVKLFATLKWWYKREGRGNGQAWETMKSFSLMLGKGGAWLALPRSKGAR
jgi:hypothetical protein